MINWFVLSLSYSGRDQNLRLRPVQINLRPEHADVGLSVSSISTDQCWKRCIRGFIDLKIIVFDFYKNVENRFIFIFSKNEAKAFLLARIEIFFRD